MPEPTEAAVEAAARAWDEGASYQWEHDDERATNDSTRNPYRAALAAAAQVQPADGGSEADCGCGNPDAHRHGPWSKEDQRYEDGCREDRPHDPQPAPEVDEREALWRARHPNVARSPLYDAGWADARRSQPAPRTVTAAGVEAAKRKADNDCPKGSTFWTYRFLAALGITVEVSR